MAKYDISAKGAADLRQLAKDLNTINSDIENNGKTLKKAVANIGNRLGTYEDKILELVQSVTASQKKGRDSVDQLAKKITALASEIETLVSAGL